MSKRRVALLFPGQGAQSVGMGKAFAEHYAIARETFEEANDLLGRNLSKILFEGPIERLTETRNSQTGLFVTCFAVWRVVEQELPELHPIVGAGFSLGEYTALAAGQWLGFKEALKLVDFRGKAMQEACESLKGVMAAVIGLSSQEVEDLANELKLPQDLWIANFNAPDQTVVSGTEKGIEALSAVAKAKGARRVLPLNVQGAFHSGLMREAEAQLNAHLGEYRFAEKGLPLVMNVSGKLASTAEEVKHSLSEQMTHSVRWEQSVPIVEQQGIELMLEIGCGKVLAGLNKRIGAKVPTLSIDKREDLEAVNRAFV